MLIMARRQQGIHLTMSTCRGGHTNAKANGKKFAASWFAAAVNGYWAGGDHQWCHRLSISSHTGPAGQITNYQQSEYA
jgi:hypothetical protein